MADYADARRRAEEALRYDHDHANSPEVRRRLRGAVEALLAAGPEAPPPPSDAVREAEEELQRIDSLLARRITLDGLTRVQKIALALRVCEETDPKGEVAARYVCRGGQKGEGR